MTTNGEIDLITSAMPTVTNGCYVVLLPRPDAAIEESVLSNAATLLQLKPAELNRILSLGQALPATRTATVDEANAITGALRGFGIESIAVSGRGLSLESPSKKVSALEFSDDTVVAKLIGSNQQISATWDEIVLLVTGRLHTSRVESEERRRRGRTQTVDSRHFSADESVLDIYVATSNIGWRIRASNFDFSCLGTARSMTAFENFKLLTDVLQERAPKAEFANSYAQARAGLEIVWPLQSQTRIGDWRRHGAGKIDSATVTTIDNESQFTRYSRLRYFLRMHR